MKSFLRHMPLTSLAIYTVVAIIIYIFSSQLQWTADDIAFQFRFDNGEPIFNVFDILPSQIYHYFHCNGRFLWHFHSQLYTALLGHQIFGFFNAIAYVTLIMYCLKLVDCSIWHTRCVLTATLLLLFMLDTHYVPSCQIGFVWGGCLTLIFLLLFRCRLDSQGLKRNFILSLMLSAYSCIAGSFCEVYSVGVSCALAFYAICNLRHLTFQEWLMGVSYVLGCAVLCLSPASINRAESMHISFILSLMHFVIYCRALYVFVLVFCWSLIKGYIGLRPFVSENKYYFIAILSLIFFAFAVGVESNRQLFGVELFSVILTLKILKKCPLATWLLVFFCIVVVCLYSLKWCQILTFNNKYFEYSEKISKSVDGRVYIDFPEPIKIVDATRCFAISEGNEYESSSIYCLQQGHFNLYSTQILTLPESIDSVLSLPIKNRVWEFLPDRYVVMQDVTNPAKFVHHRFYNFCGLKYPCTSYEITFDSISPLNTTNYRIKIVSFYVPFIEDGGIEIIQ